MARGKRLEISGENFGFWTVLSRDKIGHNRASYWLCRCSCGKTKSVKGSLLVAGESMSCGCGRMDSMHKGAKRYHARSGFKGGLTNSIGVYKRNAQKRNLSWEITDDQAAELMLRDCFYCGGAPSMEDKQCVYLNKVPFRNGIDRVVNSSGYEILNCVPCCKVCNHAKATMSQADFLSWVSRIAQHQGFTTYNPPPIQEDQSMKWTVM